MPLKNIVYSVLGLVLSVFVFSEALGQDRLPAFPGAEGHGKYVTGGRGGKVIYVTNLNDDNNPGSLRYALNQTGARIILFKISGTIQLKSKLGISKGDVTISGQTAPGDGICLRDYPVSVDADNVIIRYMRFRMGDETDQEADALGGRFRKNIIIDHCSMSWSTDECVSFYQNENFTLQWCIISESLRNSVHAKGAHGYGGVWGGRNASFHHNLLAHHDSRNPRLGEYAGDVFALTDLVDLRNNVIYNWVGNSCYGGEAMNANIVNCYYKPGPGTTKKERIVSIDKNKIAGTAVYDTWGKFYISGNVLEASSRATADNWTYGVYNQYHSSYGTVPETEKIAMRRTNQFNPGEITTHTAEIAYLKVLDYSGASLKRDTIDKRILKDVRTGTATFMTGGNGSVNGIIDTQSAVGGWPILNSTTAPVDSDSDGMPDEWETQHSLNPSDPADAQTNSIDGGYPNVEVYLNSLVATISENQLKDGIYTGISSLKKTGNPIEIYFNGNTGILKINHHQKIKMVQVYSMIGQLQSSKAFSANSVEIAIPQKQKGVFIVRVYDDTNSSYSQKVLNF